MYECTTKSWGVQRGVTYFRGGPEMCDRGGGSKLVQNRVTFFMDGPLC